MILKDPYDRPLLNLRISVNHECNLNCFFCHAEGYRVEDKELMTPEDISQLVEILAEFGIRSVKLTGGEPLLRDDLEEIVAGIKRVRRVEDIGLTTNGVLLEDRIESLVEAGLDRVNVNIPSLDRAMYRRITGADVLEKVLRGVEKSLSSGVKRLKINRVMLKGLNDMELDPLIEFAA
ncbi:MAG: GTP 3',8-cyclase MoaA, partial [Thermoproteota archaeon]